MNRYDSFSHFPSIGAYIGIRISLCLFIITKFLININAVSSLDNYNNHFADSFSIQLNDGNFSKFLSENKNFFLCLCEEKFCRDVKKILTQVGKKWGNEVVSISTGYSKDVANINSDTSYPPKSNLSTPPFIIATAFFDPVKFRNFLLPKEFVYEGVPTLYYVNRNHGEVIPFLGGINSNNILKFLKFKLIFDVEEIKINDIRELDEKMLKDKIYSAIIFLGNPTRSNLSFETLAKASKNAGIHKIFVISENKGILSQFDIQDENGYNIAIYKPHKKVHKLDISLEDQLDVKRLCEIIMINDRIYDEGFFHLFNDLDLELALNKNISTLFYLYSDKNQLPKETEFEFFDLAKKYKNEISFVKGSINAKTLKRLKFPKVFNITRADLPIVIFTGENLLNDDDVEKYVLKSSNLLKVLKTMHEKSKKKKNQNMTSLKEMSEDQNIEFTIHDVMNKNTIENFFSSVKKGELEKIYTSENEEAPYKMVGETFEQVINEAVKEDHEILLLICPNYLKQYSNARSVIERVYEKLFQINEGKILFDEFDPFTNELSLIEYKYYPTLVYIQRNPNEIKKNWSYKKYEGKFLNEDIIKFIKENSKFEVKINTTLNYAHINREEQKNPIYPVLKYRSDSKFLSDNLIKYDVGLKRKWFVLKKNRLVLNDDELKAYETGNEYEDDLNEYDKEDLNNISKEKERKVYRNNKDEL